MTTISACMLTSAASCSKSIHHLSSHSPLISTMSALAILYFFFKVDSTLRLSSVSLLFPFSRHGQSSSNGFLQSGRELHVWVLLYNSSLLIVFIYLENILRILRGILLESFWMTVFVTFQDAKPYVGGLQLCFEVNFECSDVCLGPCVWWLPNVPWEIGTGSCLDILDVYASSLAVILRQPMCTKLLTSILFLFCNDLH